MEQGNYGYSTGGYTISGLDRLKNTSGTLHIGDAPKAGRKWNRITPEGKRWLIENFSELKNADLAAHLGISESNIHRLAREHGLTKSAEMLDRTHKEVAKKALLTKEINGTDAVFKRFDSVDFSYGYTRTHMEWECRELRIGYGNPDWGAEKGKKYFVFELGRRLA